MRVLSVAALVIKLETCDVTADVKSKSNLIGYWSMLAYAGTW